MPPSSSHPSENQSSSRNKTETVTNGSKVSRIRSDPDDPDVLKEQALLMLFDSLWPQVINIIGGLVQRYSTHFISASGQSTALSRDSSVSRRVGSSIDNTHASHPQILPSTTCNVDYWRRPNTHTAEVRGKDYVTNSCRIPDFSFQNSLEEEDSITSLTEPGLSSSRLLTARALMQFSKAPLSPVFSRDNNVVSLPSLDVHQTSRPLSSASAFSARNYSARNSFRSLAFDFETLGRNDTNNRFVSPSLLTPPWDSKHISSISTSSFLPPISKPSSGSPNSALNKFNFFSQNQSRNESSRLMRRNSDTMAKMKASL